MAFGGVGRVEPLVFEISSGVSVQVVPLRGNRISIGRSPDNTIILDDPQVSRHHARLDHLETGAWQVSDLSSRNGTLLNGIQIGARPVVFRIGDQLVIGSSTIRVRASDSLSSAGQTVLQDGEQSQLSPRERSVLQLVVDGCTDQEIATRLSISVRTVHSHLDSVRQKTGARRRSEMVREAIERQLI